MDKNKILESIHNLIYHNVYCSNPNDEKWAGIAANGYEKRIIGFKAEIEYKRKLVDEDNNTILDGGILLPLIPKANALDKPVYITITSDLPNDDYKDIYAKVSSLSCPRMFFIHHSEKEWYGLDIMGINVPVFCTDMKIYEFIENEFIELEKGLNEIGNTFTKNPYKRYIGKYKLNHPNRTFIESVLSNYEKEELLEILMTRFIFDGLIGFGKKKGIPTDIDLITKNKETNQYKLLEIKEKDRSKTTPHGFGMDITRMNDIIGISDATGLAYDYIVKHVNNQRERKFIEWLSIDMRKFKAETKKNNHVKDGGIGMATANKKKPKTVVINYDAFSKI